MNIEKKNKALSKLPKHKPPDSIWDAIEQRLPLQESLHSLPTHTPTDHVWQTIDQKLESKNQLTWRRYIAVAATILFFLSSPFAYIMLSAEEPTFQYSQEDINVKLLETDWSTTEAAAAQIHSFCEAQRIACSSRMFKELEKELTTLDDAKTELETAMQLVGKNTDLIAQMTSIELERSTVLKEMMNEVL